MKPNEAPEALNYDLLGPHVGHRVNQAYTVESKLNEVPVVVLVQIVTRQGRSVLLLFHIWTYK